MMPSLCKKYGKTICELSIIRTIGNTFHLEIERLPIMMIFSQNIHRLLPMQKNSIFYKEWHLHLPREDGFKETKPMENIRFVEEKPSMTIILVLDTIMVIEMNIFRKLCKQSFDRSVAILPQRELHGTRNSVESAHILLL